MKTGGGYGKDELESEGLVAGCVDTGAVRVVGGLGAAGYPPREKLAKAVRHELVMLPFYSVFDNLSFRVDGDQVTLLGEVTRPTLKTGAERVVRGIPGVSK